jgi:hypothetical protein
MRDVDMTQSLRLTGPERRQLADDGYVLRTRVFSPDECGAMARDVESLVDDLLQARRSTKHTFGSYLFEVQKELGSVVKWEPGAPDVVQGVEPFAHISKPLADWALDARLIDPSKDVVGAEAVELFTEKITMKRARTGGPIVLHQDYPYWKGMTAVAGRIMTALIYLDDANVHNGCLEVVPGSHRDGLQQGKSVEGFGSNEIDQAAFDTKRLVPVEAPAGSVVFFGGFLVHRSLPNRSEADRRALLYSYQPAGHPRMLDLNCLIQKSPRAADGVRSG